MLIHKHELEKTPAGLLFIDFAHAYDYISQDWKVNLALWRSELPLVNLTG